MVETKRLKMYPATREQMEKIIDTESCEELKAAYSEMLNCCLEHSDEWEWYAMWNIELLDGTHVGELCFRGLDASGVTEIGYGILEERQGQGYATEAVKAVTEWALQNKNVTAIEAETDVNNIISQKLLKKCGFIENGIMGEEGPRFVLTRE